MGKGLYSRSAFYEASPEFLEAVHPRIALISVGRHNVFGHPASTTLQRIHELGIHIYRTDRCGAIRMTIAEQTTVSTQLACDGDQLSLTR